MIANFFLRIAMYTICGVIMRGATQVYVIDENQMKDALCNAIYPSSLYIMQGCLEGLVCIIILVISKGVAAYVASKRFSIQSGNARKRASTRLRLSTRSETFDLILIGLYLSIIISGMESSKQGSELPTSDYLNFIKMNKLKLLERRSTSNPKIFNKGYKFKQGYNPEELKMEQEAFSTLDQH